MNGLFQFKNKMSSHTKDKNHLYDNIDDEINEGEDFTEADLKNDEKKEDLIVKSTPTKYSQVV